MGSLQLPVILLASAFVAIGFSFVAQNPLRVLWSTAVLSALGYAVFTAASTAHLGTVWSSAAAAVVVGVIAIPYTQWFKAPAAAFTVCAILPLLPGLSLYQGLSATTRPSGNGISPLVTALSIALALAGGLTSGEYVGIVLWRVVARVSVAEDGIGTIGPARGAIAAHPRYRPAIPPATEALSAPQVRRGAERSAAGMDIIAQGSPGDGERSIPVGRFWGMLMVA